MILWLLAACGPDTTVSKTGAPLVTILEPAEGASFTPGETLTLCADVSDDSTIDELQLSLDSSLEGQVAVPTEGSCDGGNVTATFTLGEGDPTLTLTVFDPDGNAGADQVTLAGAPDQDPFCSVDAPRDGETLDILAPFSFLATVSDAETPVEALAVDIADTLHGDLWAGAPNLDGTVSVELTLQNPGEDTIVVGVTDERGHRATCQSTITLDSCIDLDDDGVDTCEDDCDDSDPSVYPGAPELENGVDDDCDTLIDDGTRLYDDDGDGYAEVDGDCDDTDADIHPGAHDVWYDGVDSDCDGSDDDQDHDGYGVADDCDDLDPAINPGAADRWYDGVDSDCDGADDFDADADGFESDAYGGTDCDDADGTVFPGAPEVWYDGVDEDCSGDDDADQDADGYVASAMGGTDCDDLDAGVNPGATEVWYDGTDQDCDGDDDDQDHDGYALGVDCLDTDATRHPGATDRWYDGVDSDCDGADDYDADADGYDSDAYGGADCDDGDATIYPGAPEIFYDGIDQDCSGDADNDQDGDGYLSLSLGGSDCNDGDASVHPEAPEIWYDGVDQDCDGNDDDQDGDGWALGPDCADTDPLINPDATELWYDGIDENCDGADDDDQDGDGWEDLDHGGTDCEDTVASVHPGATEVRDGYDNDCDDACDEGLLAAGDVIVTELLKNPYVTADSDGEWFEVYNTTSIDIRMCGWTISDSGTDSFTMTAGEAVLVPAGGFAVFGRNASASANGGVTEDYEYGSEMSLGNGADEVILTLDGVEIDRVAYLTTGWPDPTGAALSLDPAAFGPGSDETANDAGADWCTASTVFGTGDKGTPGAANDPC